MQTDGAKMLDHRNDNKIYAKFARQGAEERCDSLTGGRRCGLAAFCIVLLLAGACLLAGCGRGAEPTNADASPNGSTTSHRDNNPRVFLKQVFARYRYSASYRDRAQVRLVCRSEGATEERLAPLEVWFDRQRLYVKAYDVRLWRDAEELLGWLTDPETDNFDGQVLRTSSSHSRPDIEFLFRDPILADRIAAGLAGPPPQLEWLFSPQPMERLFSASHHMRFINDTTIDGRLCRGIQIDTGPESYRFWIDRQSGLVRRIEFPTIHAPLIAGSAPRQLQLSLELVNATFDEPRQGPDFEPLPQAPKYVSRLVPLPPPEPASVLGRRPNAFRVASTDGHHLLTEQGSTERMTLVLRVTADDTSALALGMFEQWARSVPVELQDKLRFCILSDTDVGADFLQHTGLPLLIDHDGRGASALALPVAGIVVQDVTGRIVWHQADVSSSSLVAIGAIIADALNGVDVPKRARAQWQEYVAAYQQALAEARVGARESGRPGDQR